MCCCRLFDHEVHHYSLFLSSFASCLPDRVSCSLSFCIFISMFALMLVCFISDLGFVPAALSIFLHLRNKNKNNYGRVRVYKQIADL